MHRKVDAEQKFSIGGQAVIEGVMFRGRNHWSVAVRKEDGSIIAETFPLNLRFHGSKISRVPFLRGFFVLADTLYLGFKALSFSAKHAYEEEVSLEGRDFGIATAMALVIAVLLFVVLPLYGAKLIVGTGKESGGFLFSAVEGILRLTIFVGYLLSISISPDIRRVFAYHGAEHMVIHAFEHEGTVDPESAKKYSPLHLSCGTSFIIFVLIIMIFIHTFIKGGFILALLQRLIIIPVVAGISYEIIRFARRHEDSLFVKLISLPGLLVQKLTTRIPEDSQLEVASVSLKSLLEAENIQYETSRA